MHQLSVTCILLLQAVGHCNHSCMTTIGDVREFQRLHPILTRSFTIFDCVLMLLLKSILIQMDPIGHQEVTENVFMHA